MGSALNREVVVQYLNQALSTELASLVRSKRRYYAADLASDELREELLGKAIDGSMHTDRLVERILELGGAPNFRATESGLELSDTSKGLDEDLQAERSAIADYQNILSNLGATDAASRHVLEAIILREQHYIERLSRHLGNA